MRKHRGADTMADGTTVPVEKVTLVEKQGKTRGKNPRDIKFMVLSGVPNTMAEFAQLTGLTKESEYLELLTEGFNSQAYGAASDEIGEFIPDNWDKETQNQFRLAVRNYSKLTNQSIEDSVNLILPGVEKGFAAKQAEKLAEAAKTAEGANTTTKTEDVAPKAVETATTDKGNKGKK